jgi:hypothetical protein
MVCKYAYYYFQPNNSFLEMFRTDYRMSLEHNALLYEPHAKVRTYESEGISPRNPHCFTLDEWRGALTIIEMNLANWARELGYRRLQFMVAIYENKWYAPKDHDGPPQEEDINTFGLQFDTLIAEYFALATENHYRRHLKKLLVIFEAENLKPGKARHDFIRRWLLNDNILRLFPLDHYDLTRFWIFIKKQGFRAPLAPAVVNEILQSGEYRVVHNKETDLYHNVYSPDEKVSCTLDD